jgi:hypothetical protein
MEVKADGLQLWLAQRVTLDQQELRVLLVNLRLKLQKMVATRVPRQHGLLHLLAQQDHKVLKE